MKGVILAAGEGSRMRSVTYGCFPKELLPIGNVPTIIFPLEGMRLEGITNVLIVIAARTKQGIIDGLQGGRRFGMELQYAVQEKGIGFRSGLGAAILTAKSWTRNEDFVVACGDSILCNLQCDNPLSTLKPLISLHKKTDSIATILVYPTINIPRRYGVVRFRKYVVENEIMFGEVERMVEKPNSNIAKELRTNSHYYILSGYYVFKPSIFSYIEKTKPGVKDEIQITDAMQLAIEDGKKVTAVVHAKSKNGELYPGNYWDVGVPKDYKSAQRNLLKKDITKWVHFR